MAFDRAGAAAEHERRQRERVVLVAVAHVAAVQEDRVVEHRAAVAVRESPRASSMKSANTCAVIALHDARASPSTPCCRRDARAGGTRRARRRARTAVADLGRHHEARDARHVGLERARRSGRTCRRKQLVEARHARPGTSGKSIVREVALRSSSCEPPLDLAHAVEIVVDERAVLAAERALQGRSTSASHHVEQARDSRRESALRSASSCRGRRSSRTLCAGRTPSAAASSACGTRSCGRSCSRRCRRTPAPPPSSSVATSSEGSGVSWPMWRAAIWSTDDAAVRRMALPRRARSDSQVAGTIACTAELSAGLLPRPLTTVMYFLSGANGSRIGFRSKSRPIACRASSDSSPRRSACCP